MENEPEIREEARKKMSLKWKILIGILAALVLVFCTSLYGSAMFSPLAKKVISD